MNLYFIAIIPPPEISKDVIAFQTDFSTRFGSKAALKAMPHLTLKAPFQLPDAEHLRLLRWFQNLYFNLEPFQIELKDFGAFHNKNHPVIFLRPIINVPLYSLQKEIMRSFHFAFPALPILNLELKFTPHITLAYRDLDVISFKEAWQEYGTKKYAAEFMVDSFCLLQHNRKTWEIMESYQLLRTI
ncbi:MAG: hypothetical protein JWP81_4633 [Ferruginibacter sp.]|nr:hypothetical protein [Ferruginibacter sp.]